MSKYIHRAKTLPAIPMDFGFRFDASNTDGMTFTTDEATGDIATWTVDTSGTAGITLIPAGTGTVDPVRQADPDGYMGIFFTDLENFLEGNYPAEWDRADQLAAGEGCTTFAVFSYARADQSTTANRFAYSSIFETCGPRFSSTVGPQLWTGGGYGASPTNAASATLQGRLVWGTRLKKVATDDNYVDGFVGTSLFDADVGPYTDSAINGPGRVILGSLATSATAGEGYIYELISYPRQLSDAEAAKVANYLSNKWGAQNSDSASADIELASTADTWTNNTLDPDGEGSANHPGSQPGEYSIVRVGDRDAIYLDKNYPTATWGSLVKYWFDASVTSGMTFATGDARSGGTVSSWTDITGATTMNTTKSGDAAVDYLPSFKGKPAIQGGTSGTPKSLEGVTDPLFSTTTGHQRLFWCVVDWDDVTVSAAPCGPAGVNLWASTTTGHTGDLPYGFLPACTYNAISSFRPVTVKDPRVGKHIFVWRQTKNAAANGDLESWYAGVRLPDDAAVTWAGFTGCAVGALTSSTYDAGGGRTWEMGAVNGAGTAISDAEVDGLIRYLCEKYDVDYMPDTTPMDIGLHARSTGTVAQTDCALWYRSDKNLSETVWGLHPKCAALHTTPGNFALVSYADPGEVATANSRKAYRASDSSPVTSLVQANNYSAAETVDFPADTNGCSSFGVKFHNSSTTTSSGSQCGHYTGYTRFNGVSATIVQHYESNAAKNWTAADAWVLFGGSYHYDSDGTGGIGEAGTPDGDPYVWYFANDITPQVQNAPAATSFNTKMTVGSSIGGALPGDIDCHELFMWKHPLTAREISNLKRYVNWRYGLGLTP